MIRIFLRIIAVIIFSFQFPVKTFAQLNYNWQGSIRGQGDDIPRASAVDNAGNFYIAAGMNSLAVDIDLGPGVNNISEPNSGYSYVVKYDSSGTLLSSFLIGSSTGNIMIEEMFIAGNGDILLSGEFSGCMDFDPGPGTHNVCSIDVPWNGFVSKYTASGNLVFVKRVSRSFMDIEYDTVGNVLLSINAAIILNLDSTLIPVSIPLGPGDMQIVVLDSGGALIQASVIDAPVYTNYASINKVKFASDGSYLLGGYLTGPGCTFGNLNQNVTTSYYGGVIAKINPSGGCEFAAEFGNALNVRIIDIDLLSGGRIAFLGQFDQQFDADPGPGVLTFNANGSLNFFYGLLDSLGSLIYAYPIYGSNYLGISQIRADSYDNYYISGYINDTLYANPVIGVPHITAVNWSDSFISRFDQNGKCNFILPIEDDTIGLNGVKIQFINQNKLLLLGSFCGISDFNFGLGINTDTSYYSKDLFVAQYEIRDIPINSSSYYAISGSVFHDANSNGFRDTSEIMMPRQLVEIQPGNNFTLTDENGFYLKYLLAGNYSVSLPLFGTGSGFNGTCTPTINSVTLSPVNVHDTNNDFAVFPLSTEHELQVSVTPLIPFRTVNENIIQTTAKNNFFFNSSASVKLETDSALNIISTFPVADSIVSSQIYWNWPNVSPFSTKSFLASIIDTVIFEPDSVMFSSSVGPVVNDFLPANNYDTINVQVMGSLDPNMKIVNPSGELTTTQVQNGITLDYTIYFQNTGSASAWRVIIIDTLSTFLDLSTLEIVDVSHPNCNVSMLDERTLVFQFNNINLPDSSTNEPGSHGFVRYKLKPFGTLLEGDKISNSAGIVFDFNPAVITNTVANEIVLPVSLNDINNNNDFIIYPSITDGSVYIKSDFNNRNEKITFSIYSATGQSLVDNRKITSGEKLLYRFKNENAGIYFIFLEVNGIFSRHKICYFK